MTIRVPQNLRGGGRLLQEEQPSISPYAQPGLVAWYCFLAIILVPCTFFTYCVARRRWKAARTERLASRQHEETSRRARIQLEISRIEANIVAFSEREKQHRRKALKRALRKCTRVRFVELSYARADWPNDTAHTHNMLILLQIITASELVVSSIETADKLSYQEPAKFGPTGVCSVCLEAFAAGDVVIHAQDTEICRHAHHEECILAWLASRPDGQCPCCRQEFVGLENDTPQTSVSSEEEFSAAMRASWQTNGFAELDHRSGARF